MAAVGLPAPRGSELGESAKFFASDAMTVDTFGRALAMDGNVLVVGAPRSESDRGDAYVFERIGGAWQETARLVPAQAAQGDFTANRVAIAGDHIFLGAPCANAAGGDSGALYEFRKVGSAWVEQPLVLSTDIAPGDGFGASVAVFDAVMVAGAPLDDDANPSNSNTESGAAYVFHFTGSAWVQQAKLLASDLAAGDGFGLSVEVCGDLIVVGAPADDGIGGDLQGSAYVFERVGTTWVERQKLTSSDGRGIDRFGWSLAVEGREVLVAAHFAGIGGTVYSFVPSGSTWIEEGKLQRSNPVHDEFFGYSIDRSGNTAVVGAPGSDVPGAGDAGAAFAFVRGVNGWVEVARLSPSDPTIIDSAGLGVAIEDNVILVGSAGDDDMATNAGAVYEFLPDLPRSYCTGKTNSLGCVPFLTSLGLPSTSLSSPFRVQALDLVPNEAGFLLYGFSKANLNFHGGKLCVKTPFQRWLPAKPAGTSGGPSCSGSAFRNFNARIQSGVDPLLTAGQVVRSQWLQRDPGNPTFFGDALTNALQFTLHP